MIKLVSKIKYVVSTTVLSVVFLSLGVFPVSADELVISGNGSNSESGISVSSTAQTTIDQSNQVSVTNNVNIEASTGENDALGNTSLDTSVNTGNISSDTSIQNSVNSSQVSLNCCPKTSTDLEISNNGSDSKSEVVLSQSQDIQISVNQDASIQNTINGSANTGLNSASQNSFGNVSIQTGNIDIKEEVKNQAVNKTDVLTPQGGFDLKVNISSNGSNSKNLIILSVGNSLWLNLSNQSNIFNTQNWDLNTGENSASENTYGSVSITTGDINAGLKIENGPINSNTIISSCCNLSNTKTPNPVDPDDPGDPSGGPAQSSLPSSKSNPSSDNNQTTNGSGQIGSSGQVLAAITAAGQILPKTGSIWTILLTLISLLMFILGLYLRQHPGRDPSSVYAYL